MTKLLSFLLLLNCTLLANDYEFKGRHFLASYNDCDTDALSDVRFLRHVMDYAVQSSGASILEVAEHVFEPNAITIVYLLAESHASIHTYPESGACFVDLFTCGDKCTFDEFDATLRTYLQPKKISGRLLLRYEDSEELPLEFGAIANPSLNETETN